ncbi:MAG: phosphate ABC transporter substrate-binding protein [Deltaproteobacteria bacterium]|jgi:phosphate transport system substrate-binding protein|nr:phosphate ABC transporter substrate-binding protein [Deltaproteobacteria bacterium]
MQVAKNRTALVSPVFVIICLLALGLGTVAVWLLSQANGAGPSLRLSGSTTLLPAAQRAAEAYLQQRPDLLLTVSGSGTGEGVRSLIDGNIDIADASRDLKPAEKRRAEAAGRKLVRHVVALDCLAVVVHPENPVRNLTLEQLKGIYLGDIVNWREVGGEDRVIVPVNRDSSSGTFELWVEKILHGARHRPDAQVQSSSGGVAYAVAGNRFALGYVSLGFVSEAVKAIEVDGVAPSREAALDGRYPIVRELYMFVRTDASDEVLAFLAFLRTPPGEAAVEAEGFLKPPAPSDAAGQPDTAGQTGWPDRIDRPNQEAAVLEEKIPDTAEEKRKQQGAVAAAAAAAATVSGESFFKFFFDRSWP